MKYVVLVSHGDLATGLKSSLEMLAGKKDEVLACGLEDGKTADQFAIEFKEVISVINDCDELILLGDLIGGSPLTTACNVVAEIGLLNKTTVIGGMNLPLALTTVLMKDNLDNSVLVDTVLEEAKTALQQFKIVEEEEDDDI